MIPFWKKAPFFRLLLPLIAGIVAEYYVQPSIQAIMIWVLLGLAFWVIFQKFSSFHKFYHSYASGIGIHIGLFSLGMACVMCHELRFNGQHFSRYFQAKTIYCIRIEEPPVEKTKSYRSIATISHVIQQGSKIPVNGRCYFYFQKGEKVKTLQYASLLYVHKIPQPIPPSSDAASFDFNTYAARQGIYHQLYLNDNDYIIKGGDTSFSIYEYLFRVRSHLISIIHQYISNPQYAAVAIALLTGYRLELDRNLTQMYQSTGTIHVIAISGMHLALIYVLLQFIFRFLEKSRKANFLKELVILVLLWLFSLLTGGGASVIRAVIMFSFISVGKLIDKKGSVENALAVSAFFMLCYRPYLLWDIGFQLSYAAVLSLVIFMQPIYEMIRVQNPLLDMFWKMNAVTLSAQILTLPLCIYYFHQLPVLFLPANLLAIPLSTLALYGLLLLMVFSFFNQASFYIGNIVEWLIQIMNAFMEYLAGFRFSVIDGCSPDLSEIIILYIMIYFLFSFYRKKEKYNLFGGMLTFFILGLLQTFQFFSR
jgi:competence protein ComEC